VTAPNGTYLGSIAVAPYGEEYASGGSPGMHFTNQRVLLANDLWDFPKRELHSTQGRWISPDPAGLAAVDITDPQTWNRYAYVRNTPTGFTDPTGLGCVYLNDTGDGVDSIDNNSSQGECWSNGGYWADGYIPSASSVWINPNSNDIIIDSSVNGFLARTLAGSFNDGGTAYSQMFPIDTSYSDIINNQYTPTNYVAQTVPNDNLSEGAQKVLTAVYQRAAPIGNPCFWGEWTLIAGSIGGSSRE